MSTEEIPTDAQVKAWVDKFFSEEGSVWKMERGKNWSREESDRLMKAASLLRSGYFFDPKKKKS
jgi:hypothetical protein